MGKLTARFVGVKNGFKLDNASCFLGISLGPSYYKGEHLDAIIELIKKEKFSEGRFAMLADTLHAHNLLARDENLTLEQARDFARQEGEEWLNSEDGKKIQQLNLTRQIIRWDDIIEHPDYLKKKQLIDGMYIIKEDRRASESKTDEIQMKKRQFSEAVDRVVGQRIASIKSSSESDKVYDAQRIRPLIIDYVKEECAGELIIKEHFPCDYELYPGERNSAATFIHKNYISENTLQWLTIKFNKIGSPKKEASPITLQLSPATLMVSRRDSPVYTQNEYTTEDEADDSLQEITTFQNTLLVSKNNYRRAKKEFGAKSTEAKQARAELSHLHNVLKQAAGQISNSSGSSDENSSDSSEECGSPQTNHALKVANNS